jgi:hypothetical protein
MAAIFGSSGCAAMPVRGALALAEALVTHELGYRDERE